MTETNSARSVTWDVLFRRVSPSLVLPNTLCTLQIHAFTWTWKFVYIKYISAEVSLHRLAVSISVWFKHGCVEK
jgi:hypothetical protein